MIAHRVDPYGPALCVFGLGETSVGRISRIFRAPEAYLFRVPSPPGPLSKGRGGALYLLFLHEVHASTGVPLGGKALCEREMRG